MNSRTMFLAVFALLVAIFATAFVHPLLFLGVTLLVLCAITALVVSRLWAAMHED